MLGLKVVFFHFSHKESFQNMLCNPYSLFQCAINSWKAAVIYGLKEVFVPALGKRMLQSGVVIQESTKVPLRPLWGFFRRGKTTEMKLIFISKDTLCFLSFSLSQDL